MAQSLSEAGISTILVPDSSIFAIMSRVNKVILGTHVILANGGMFAISGSLMVATAAKAHSTPVVVCAGQFKLTPLWNLYHEHGALDFGNPSDVLGFENGDLVDKVEVVNPYDDYVQPELIDAYITNEFVLSFFSRQKFANRLLAAVIIHHHQYTGMLLTATQV
jgi:translation initiation factor eIF-2B subunit beta